MKNMETLVIGATWLISRGKEAKKTRKREARLDDVSNPPYCTPSMQF
jgi:hypothetical protein